MLALPVEGDGGRMGLKSGGLNMRIIQTQAGGTVSCHVAKEKVNVGQRTFCQANKKYLFELSCQQRSEEYIHPSAVPFPHFPLFFNPK